MERNKVLRKDIETLARHVDHIHATDSKIYRNMMHKLVLNELRQDELNKVTDLLKEIEFAEPVALYGMFDYRQRTNNERLGVEVEVIKEFRANEFDPNKLQNYKKTRKPSQAPTNSNKM